MSRKIVYCDTLSVSATSQDIVQTKEQMQVISAFLGYTDLTNFINLANGDMGFTWI